MLPHTGENNKVYIVAPSGGYGGYDWVFPKGRVDANESMEVTALREVKEEAGIDAEIISSGAIAIEEGTMSVTHYYMMRATGEPGQHDSETEQVKLVDIDEAKSLLKASARDTRVLFKAVNWINDNLDKGDSKKLQTEGLNFIGKLFFASVAAWLVGRVTGLKIKGSEEQVIAVKNAMMSSKRFQDELSYPGATVDSVMNKLNLKHASAVEFERVLGVRWPL